MTITTPEPRDTLERLELQVMAEAFTREFGGRKFMLDPFDWNCAPPDDTLTPKRINWWLAANGFAWAIEVESLTDVRLVRLPR